MKELMQAAIARGEITFRPKVKRGPKADPELEKAYQRAKTLWERQLTLDECCQICGISVNTFRYKHYTKGTK